MDPDSKAGDIPETPMTPVRPSFTLHDVMAMRLAQPVPGTSLGQVARMLEHLHQLTAPTRVTLDLHRTSNTSLTLAMAEQARVIAQSVRVLTAAEFPAQLQDLSITRIARDIS